MDFDIYHTHSGKKSVRIPKQELHAMAVPNPCKKRRRYDKKRNIATLSKYGAKAKNNPDVPSMMAPTIKQVFNPILVAHFPKTGPNMKSERFEIPKTNPYSDGLAPLSSASEG